MGACGRWLAEWLAPTVATCAQKIRNAEETRRRCGNGGQCVNHEGRRGEVAGDTASYASANRGLSTNYYSVVGVSPSQHGNQVHPQSLGAASVATRELSQTRYPAGRHYGSLGF